MRNKIIGAFAVLLLAAGLLIFNYPTISTLYNQLHQGTGMAEYDENLAKMEQEELDAYKQEAVEYNERLAGSGAVLRDAFTQGDSSADPEYDGILDMEESGVMGAIEIPGINVYLPIYHGTSADVLNIGVGHLKGTSFPVGGESTHSVLTGHRGLPTAELFTNLDQVKEGDVFYIHILKETLAYQVYAIETVLPEQVDSLGIEQGRDLVTLVTCTPYGINSHRLLIHAERTDYDEMQGDQTKTMNETLWQWLLSQKTFLLSVGIVLIALIYGIIRLIRRIRNNSRKKKEEANQ